MTTQTKLADLPAKWRKDAEEYGVFEQGSYVFHECADELEAALARQASVAPPALYQHDDGRYALALGDVARHRLTDGDPGWHRVPLDVVVGVE